MHSTKNIKNTPKAVEKTYSSDTHPNKIYLARKSTLTINRFQEKTSQTNNLTTDYALYLTLVCN